MGEIDTNRGTGIIMVWQLSINAELAARIFKHIRASIRNSVIMNAGTLIIEQGVALKHQPIKAKMLPTQQYINGFINTLVNLWSVNSVVRLQRTTDIYSGRIYQGYTSVNAATGLGYAFGVILREIRHQYNISVDVIRKRYHKFITGDEEGWEDGTAAI